METRELINLLNRAAAALETADDLEPFALEYLAEDLAAAARELAGETA